VQLKLSGFLSCPKGPLYDDHIRGFADVVDACPYAQLVISEAMRKEEFGALINCFGTRVMIANSGTYEFHRVMMLMMDRKKKGTGDHIPKWAIEGRSIWRGKVGCFGSVDCELVSLSPSDSAVSASKLEFAKLLPKEGSFKGWVKSITPNLSSVAIRLKAGEFSILLGADLEETGDHASGWSAIVRYHLPEDGKATIYKVAHHGSKTGHHPDLWREMLTEKPIAVLTPWQKGGDGLPTDGDVRRIISLTPHAFLTARRDRKVAIQRDKTVAKMIGAASRSIRVVDASSGHVRIRLKTINLATVELFGDAYRLTTASSQPCTDTKKKNQR
jgi:hypothetical protein